MSRPTILLASLLLAACVTAKPNEDAADTRDHRFTWDFGHPDRHVMLSLWPAQDEAPPRLKRQLRTNQHEGRLRLQVDGIDPGFIWQFKEPLRAGALKLDVFSEKPHDVQLFWAGTRCRAFKEECSTIVRVPAERHVVGFMLPPEPISELRLDFGQIPSLRLEVHELVIYAEATLNTGWHSIIDTTTSAQTDEGLVISAADADPWLVTEVPGMPAALVDTLELVIDAPEGAHPQVFWRGSECTHFAERCSALLTPLAEGLTATSVDLAAAETWRGRIDGLRVDPGDRPGRYVIERIELD